MGTVKYFLMNLTFLPAWLLSGHSYQCPKNYGKLELKGIKYTCQRIENGTDPPWLRFTCHGLYRWYCILTWCRDFAFCLKQSVDWQKECTWRIDELIWRSRSKNIKMESVNDGPSYSFDVQRCHKGYYINIRLFNGTMQGNGMYKIPIVYIFLFSHPFYHYMYQSLWSPNNYFISSFMWELIVWTTPLTISCFPHSAIDSCIYSIILLSHLLLLFIQINDLLPFSAY